MSARAAVEIGVFVMTSSFLVWYAVGNTGDARRRAIWWIVVFLLIALCYLAIRTWVSAA